MKFHVLTLLENLLNVNNFLVKKRYLNFSVLNSDRVLKVLPGKGPDAAEADRQSKLLDHKVVKC